MSARDEVAEAFNQAQQRIRERTGPPGGLPQEGIDQRMIVINENTRAIQDALYALADRIDALEAK